MHAELGPAVRLWPRKPKAEHDAAPPPPPPPPPQPPGPKTGDDLRKAFLQKLDARSEDEQD